MHMLKFTISLFVICSSSLCLMQSFSYASNETTIDYLCSPNIFEKTEADTVDDIAKIFGSKLLSITGHDFSFGSGNDGVTEIQASFQKASDLFDKKDDDSYKLRLLRVVFDKNKIHASEITSKFNNCFSDQPEISEPYMTWKININYSMGMIVEKDRQIIDLSISALEPN